MSSSTQLAGSEGRAITIRVSLGIKDPYSNNLDEVTFTMLSCKAMTRATQGTVFSNPNSDKTTSNLLNYEAMRWAIQGTVFSIPNSNAVTSTLLSNEAKV
jgi:hypothetical protein